MAASFKLFGVSAAAARIPLALTVLALAFAVETFARRAFRSARAGLYAALILLSSFGFFLFTRITIPDAMLCLWLSIALLCFWLTEQPSLQPIAESVILSEGVADAESKGLRFSFEAPKNLRWFCYAFSVCCALGVLTKGLIGVVFPVGIVLVHLLLTSGPRAAIARIRQLHPLSSLAIFLAIAAPWHILIALANPAQGHPAGLTYAHGALSVPLPTQGNVHGWPWFYFVNEQLLRYLNLRVPCDYDTVPLWLFWGLCLVWLMPWSAFAFRAVASAIPLRRQAWRERLRAHALTSRERTLLLLTLWAAFPPLFFSFSTRQEYYVLPALPALAVLFAGWLAQEVDWQPITDRAKKSAASTFAQPPSSSSSAQSSPPPRSSSCCTPARPRARPISQVSCNKTPPTTPSAWAIFSTSTRRPSPSSGCRSRWPLPRSSSARSPRTSCAKRTSRTPQS